MFLSKTLAKKCFPFLFVLIIGCAPSKEAIYVDPNFPQIDKITLLPAIDARIDTSIEVDMNGQIRERGLDKLEDKGYQCTLSENTGDAKLITEELLKSGDSSWIKQLGPADARWPMVLMLIDVSSNISFGSSGNAEVEGFLFDKDTGKIVWRDKGIGKVGQGGLLGLVLSSDMDEEAIGEAMKNLMLSFPEKQ